MTDKELIARLRDDVFYGDERLHKLSRHNPLHMEAADRIEALIAERDKAEAKLAKAVEALKMMCEEFRGYDLPYGSKAYSQATATLAEIKGEN